MNNHILVGSDSLSRVVGLPRVTTSHYCQFGRLLVSHYGNSFNVTRCDSEKQAREFMTAVCKNVRTR